MKEIKSKKGSSNIKKGAFKQDELELYRLNSEEIEVVLTYQKLLPILQEENATLINARDLHFQLGAKKMFAHWIKEKIKKYEFQEEVDYFTSCQKRQIGRTKGFKEFDEYYLTLDTAKQLAMVQNNSIGRVARKYFIYIEKAFNNRNEWNIDREITLINFEHLKRALCKYRKQLIDFTPEGFKDEEIAEFYMLNKIILGMSAKEYRALHDLPDNYPIRNTFTEDDLEYMHILEQYDSDLIEVQNIFDYEQREDILLRKYTLLCS